MSSIELALFDLDGCLVDSTPAITGAINAALVQLGVPDRPLEELRWCVGPPLVASLTTLLLEAGADPGLAARAVELYREIYVVSSLEQTTVIHGIPELLTALAPSARVAVVTSKPGAFARPILRALGLLDAFEGVHAPEADHLLEPKTVTLTRALGELAPGRDPGTAVMIGDRSHDIVAGIACGTWTVGVTWGAGDREELVAAGADHVVDEPAQVLGLVSPSRSVSR